MIVTKAEEEHSDSIVMSTHGRTGLDQIMLGSVTAKVVARAPCPVLSIRPHK
jgi:nucleotide-binding universal stress UspA family protein